MSTAQRSPPSRTSTLTLTQTHTTPTDTPPQTVLHLRAGPSTERRVVWTEETVDNEGLGKKKSKICCIYHKPRAFDESSSDESSSDESSSETDHHPSRGSNGHRHRLKDDSNVEEEESSESDGGAGDGRARPLRKPGRHHHSHKCNHSDHTHKPNKYDVQPNGTGKGKEKS
ncbi:hypothetical protein C359_03017 [Cryptococcus neoformans Bt120]|nr:hypothetical protein C360_00398 [Cryptococcus neoformans var. grubii Bt15]OXG41608.1 hypothetical protein C359_03017 [Cryptococcus neoformans var. grubii Bt120]